MVFFKIFYTNINHFPKNLSPSSALSTQYSVIVYQNFTIKTEKGHEHETT